MYMCVWQGSEECQLYIISMHLLIVHTSYAYIQWYSRKYWWSLNLAVWSRNAGIKILAYLDLAVRYGIVIHIYAYEFHTETLADFNLAVVARTAKFKSPPHFLAIRYIVRTY